MIRLRAGFRPNQTGPPRCLGRRHIGGLDLAEDFTLGAKQDDAPAALDAAAVLAASFVNNANAATINNVASGSVAVVGADCCRTGQVFSNIILDAANNRSNYLVFDLSSLASQLAGQDARSANLTLLSPASTAVLTRRRPLRYGTSQATSPR